MAFHPEFLLLCSDGAGKVKLLAAVERDDGGLAYSYVFNKLQRLTVPGSGEGLLGDFAGKINPHILLILSILKILIQTFI